MLYIVYQTTNNVNGKVYVGLHKSVKENDSYLGSGRALKDAFKKYGKQNFSRSNLFVFNTLEEASIKEAEIVDLNYVKRKDTYNLILGGYKRKYHKRSNKGRKHTKKARENMSKGRIEYCNSDYGKQNLSRQNSGKLNPFFGKTHTEKVKNNIAKSNVLKKSKSCILDGIEYESRKSAAEALNVTPATISLWFKKGRGHYS